MATSNNFNTSNEYIKYSISVTENSQNIAENYTNVTVKVRVFRTNTGYSTYGSGKVYCEINGTTYTAAITPSQVITDSGIYLFSLNLNVAHNMDGTKLLTCSARITHSQFTASTNTFSVNLKAIPRATKPSLSSETAELGQTVTIRTPGATGAFIHKLEYNLNGTTGTIGTNVESSKTWSIPLDLANAMPSTTKGKCEIICKTYTDGRLIGTKSVYLTVNVPNSMTPTITSIDVKEGTVGIPEGISGFIQNKSAFKITINAASVYGATIKAFKTAVFDELYNTRTFTTGTIKSPGKTKITAVVTDTRCRTATLEKDVDILAYHKPKIKSFNVVRENDGPSLKFEYSYDVAPINNKNTVEFKILVKNGAELYKNTSLYTNTGESITGAVYDVNKTYEVTATLSDKFTSVSKTIQVPTAYTILDFNASGRGLAIGKVSEHDELEIAMNMRLTGAFIQEQPQIPTLQNNWVNYGEDYQTVEFWKDKMGVVHIHGLIKDGVTAFNTTIFTLPEGYRPRAREIFTAATSTGYCSIYILPSGNINIGTGGDAKYTSLSSITFKTKE